MQRVEEARDSRSAEFWAGVRAELPIVIGGVPFGFIFGVLAVAAGIPPWLAFGMSYIVFAGSAQFVGAQLIGGGAPALVIWLTTAIINARHLLYSAALAPYTQRLNRGWRWLLAYLLTDEAYIVTALRYEALGPSPTRHYFWLGAGLMLWASWQLSTAVGILFGAQVPSAWSLDFTLALTFIAMLTPVARRRPTIGAALVAALVSVVASPLPYNLGLLLAATCGIVSGLLLSRGEETA